MPPGVSDPGARSAASTPRPRRHGALERKACQEKALQDLAFRTEYLATLRADVATIAVPPGEEFRHTSAALPAPHNLGAVAEILRSKGGGGGQALPATLKPPYVRKSAAEKDTAGQSGSPSGPAGPPGQQCRAAWEELGSPGPGRAAEQGPPVWRGQAAHRSKAEADLEKRIAWEALPQQCSGHLLDGVGAMVAACPGVPPVPPPRSPGGAVPAPELLDQLKVEQLPDGPKGASEQEAARHAGRCRYTHQLTEEGLGDTTRSVSSFARLFWRMREAERDGPVGWTRFRRADGAGSILGTHKFLLTERDLTITRQAATDPFHARALATGDGPAPVVPEGHYFEVMVKSLYKSPSGMGGQHGSAPAGPGAGGRHGSEGLVLGVTATTPEEIAAARPAAKGVADVPRTWSVALSGKVLITGSSVNTPMRTAGQERLFPRKTWHEKPAAGEGVQCPWPPPPPAPDSHRYLLPWSVDLRDGVTVGLLVTSFGGICVIVNGQRELFIPDVGVPAGTSLYPIVEVYNHVRSVQALPAALPPS